MKSLKFNILKTSLILNGILLLTVIFILIEFKEELFSSMDKEVNSVNIVMFGDSIIDDADWGKLLNRNDIKTRGFRGFATSQFRWIITDSVIKYNPKICFLSGGINDIGSGIPVERTKLNFKDLIKTLVSNNILPVIQSTLYQENNPKSKILVDSINNFLKDYCARKNIYFLDINSKLSSNIGLKPEFSSDGTHLTQSAYKIWSSEVTKVLKLIEKE